MIYLLIFVFLFVPLNVIFSLQRMLNYYAETKSSEMIFFIVFRSILLITLYTFFIYLIQTVVRYTREKHIAIHALLPVRLKDKGFVKILLHLILILGFVFIYDLGIVVYLDLISDKRFFNHSYFGIDNIYWGMMMIIPFSIWILLFTEYYTRLIGYAFLGYLIFGPVFIMALPYSHWISYSYYLIKFTSTLLGAFAISVVFCVFLYISFIKRRSFLK